MKHRDVILARRALYLSTALATAGCPNQPPTDGGESAHEHPTARLDATTRPTAEPPLLATPWEEVMKDAPPRDVPSGLSATEKTTLEGLTTAVDAQYEAVRVVWISAPDCDPSSPECSAWKELADKATKMYQATFGTVSGSAIAPCPGAHGNTASIRERRIAHAQFIESLLLRIEERFGKLAGRYGAAGEKEWGRLLTEARKPAPMPCLSPCPMADLTDVIVSIPFADGDPTLHYEDTKVTDALERALDIQRSNGSRAKLVVRGHADPDEEDAQALGDKRARAVAGWLITKGIPKEDVTTASLGATLGVEPKGSDANRRVDFEVIVR